MHKARAPNLRFGLRLKLAANFAMAEHKYSSIAQLAEHLTVNQRVTGSSPVGRAKKHSTPFGVLCFFVFDYTQTDPLISEGTEHDRVRWTKKGERGCAAVDR